MGPINLTKVLAIFLSGSSLIGVVFIYSHLFSAGHGGRVFSHAVELNATALTAALFPLSLMAGLAIEAFSDFSVRRCLFGRTLDASSAKKSFWPSEERMAAFLRQSNLYYSHQLWKRAFEMAADQDKSLKPLISKIRKLDEFSIAEAQWSTGASFDLTSQIASALTFQKDHSENKNWIIAHYSTYFAASNFLVVITASLTLFILYSASWLSNNQLDPAHLASGVLIMLGHLALMYLLASNAFDRFFYSHLCAYRYATLLLLNSDEKSK